VSTAAVMLCKDEEDILDFTLEYLTSQVDHVLVSDNRSTDGTRDILTRWMETGKVSVEVDAEVGYYQAEKTSMLAEIMLRSGFDWVVPCDADEFWYANDGRRIADFLAGLAPDVGFVRAELYNHLPTAEDPASEPRNPTDTKCEQNPFKRIGWRQREHGALPKVACRLRPGLEIRQGNHSAYAPGSATTSGGLVVRHFSWRSPEQYVAKIRNGYRAYAATDLPDSIGAHWRMHGDPDTDPLFADRVRGHFESWFYVEKPRERPDLIYDPAPWPEGGR
jgi:Glycosyl transferase family 2